MDKQTYESLKRIVELYKEGVTYVKDSLVEKYIERIEAWINKVAKEYEE